MVRLGKFSAQKQRAQQMNAVPAELRGVVNVYAGADGIMVDDGNGAPVASDAVEVMPVDYIGKRTLRKTATKGRRGPVVCQSDDGVTGTILMKDATVDGVKPSGDCNNCELAGFRCRLTVFPRGLVSWVDDDGKPHIEAGAVTCDGHWWITDAEEKVTDDLDEGKVRRWKVGIGKRPYKRGNGEDAVYHYVTLTAGDAVEATKPAVAKVREKWPWVVVETPHGNEAAEVGKPADDHSSEPDEFFDDAVGDGDGIDVVDAC